MSFRILILCSLFLLLHAAQYDTNCVTSLMCNFEFISNLMSLIMLLVEYGLIVTNEPLDMASIISYNGMTSNKWHVDKMNG